MRVIASVVSVLCATTLAVLILCSMGAWIDMSNRWKMSATLATDSRTSMWMKTLGCNTNVSFCIEPIDPAVSTTFLQPNFEETRLTFDMFPRYNSDDYKGIVALTFFVIVGVCAGVMGTVANEVECCCGDDACQRDYQKNCQHLVRFQICVVAFVLAVVLMFYPAVVCTSYSIVGVNKSVSMFVKNSDVVFDSSRSSIDGMQCVPKSFGGYVCYGSVNDMYRLTPAFSTMLDRLSFDVNNLCATSADPRVLVIVAAVAVFVWLIASALGALSVWYGCEKAVTTPGA